MTGLTPMQAKCLDAIKRLTRDDMPPSFDELVRDLGVASKSTVHRLVHGLVERGAVALSPGRHRTIQVLGYDLPGLERHSSDHLRAMQRRISEILKGRGH